MDDFAKPVSEYRSIPNAAQPTAGQGLALDSNGQIPDPAKEIKIGLSSMLPQASAWANRFYYETDTGVVYYSNGSTWTAIRRPTATNRQSIPVTYATNAAAALAWPDGATHSITWQFLVPYDYVSGDLTIYYSRRWSATGGTTVMRVNSYRMRDATAIVQVDADVNIDVAASNTNTIFSSRPFAAANFQAGDLIYFQVSRLGADAGDTSTASVDCYGAFVEYAGRPA